MENDLISVVVPIYKVEKYLEKCISSITNQTYKNLQIILVDDGSPDGCGAICDESAEKDKRIIVIHKENGGLSDARNKGIEVATGKYITFIDSDDFISANYIEALYKLIIDNNAEISIIGLTVTPEDIEPEFKNHVSEIEVLDNKTAIKEMLYNRKFSVSACGKMYLTRYFDDVRYPIGKYFEDLFTTYKVLNKAKLIVYSNYIGYFYVRRTGSILISNFSIKNMDAIEALLQIKRNIPLDDYGISNAYASQMIECIGAMLERKPNPNEFKKLGLWKLMTEYRKSVLFDSEACKRVRAFALVSYFGLRMSISIISKYYRYRW